jgi:thiol-disulfide isomerase/thioredoxin
MDCLSKNLEYLLFLIILIFVVYYLFGVNMDLYNYYEYETNSRCSYFGGSENQTFVYWFHTPNCGHCRRMEGDWNKLKNLLKEYPNIKLTKIDVSKPENQQMSQDYEVEGVPHIVKEKNGKRDVYSGNRSAQDLFKWISV